MNINPFEVYAGYFQVGEDGVTFVGRDGVSGPVPLTAPSDGALRRISELPDVSFAFKPFAPESDAPNDAT